MYKRIVTMVQRCTDSSVWVEHRTPGQGMSGQVQGGQIIKGSLGHAKEFGLYPDNNGTITEFQEEEWHEHTEV